VTYYSIHVLYAQHIIEMNPTVGESERKKRNRLAQQRHREKAREQARKRDLRIRELEQAMKEINDAVEDDCLDRIRNVLTRITKGPTDPKGLSDGYFPMPQPYIVSTFNPAFPSYGAEHSWMAYSSLMGPLLPSFVPESLGTTCMGSQPLVSASGQQSYLL
jgi:hypothetical protein